MRRALVALALAACSSKVPDGSPITAGSYVASVHVGLKQPATGEMQIAFAVGSAAAETCGASAKGDCRIEIALPEPTTLAVTVAGQGGEARLARPDRWRTGKIMTMVASGDIAGATVVLQPAAPWLVAHATTVIALGVLIPLCVLAGVLIPLRRRKLKRSR